MNAKEHGGRKGGTPLKLIVWRILKTDSHSGNEKKGWKNGDR